MYRKTYVKINHNNLIHNIKEIKEKYSDYKYYIGVVKNNAYHHGIKVVTALKKGGINYFAVSSLEEALEIRKYDLETPILILEPISLEYIYDCINNSITITIESLEDAKLLDQMKLPYELKIHLKLDTGMNRLGFKDREELEQTVQIIKNNEKLYLEGIYTHFATSGVMDKTWDNQVEKFKELTTNINLKEVPIVHLGRSLTLVNHPKLDFCNGIRLGIIMYGFSQSRKRQNGLRGTLREWKKRYIQKKWKISKTTTENNLNLKTAFSLYSTVMSVRPVMKNEVAGYDSYKIKEDGFIATIPVGYADGVEKKLGAVMINGQEYQIISDAMDMILVSVDNTVKKGMPVEIFGDGISISNAASKLGINAYHLLNQIQNRVPRIHILDDIEEETKY